MQARSARPAFHEGAGVPLRRLPLMNRLAPEQYSRRANVVADVDQQEREVTAAVKETSEHHEAADFAEQRRYCRRSLRDETCDDLGQEQQQQYSRHELEQLR